MRFKSNDSYVYVGGKIFLGMLFLCAVFACQSAVHVGKPGTPSTPSPIVSPKISEQSGTVALTESGLLKPGGKAPPLAGWTLEEEVVSLKKLMSTPGTKHVVVSFFATWCAPCRHGIKRLEEQQNRLKDEGIRILLINIEEEKEVVREYLRKENISLTVILDPFGSFGEEYGISGDSASLPRSFLIASDLTLLAIYSIEGEDFIERIMQDANR